MKYYNGKNRKIKNVISERTIIDRVKDGKNTIIVSSGDIITPLAMDKIKSLGISITSEEEKTIPTQGLNRTSFSPNSNKIVVGSDHTGYKLKSLLKKYLTDKSFEVIDVGTNNEESCDYPDFAFEVAKKVQSGEAKFGIIIDATGIPSAITANKIPTIRAATCYNEFSAKSARRHNNANIIVLGAKTLGEESVKSILDVWLNNDFEGGRHQRRLDKITEIENKFSKNNPLH